MTLAICIYCGHRKFASLRRCQNCGASPSTVSDKVRSIALTDHGFRLDELEEFGRKISSGVGVKFNSAICTILGESLAFEEFYYRESSENGVLQCKRCNFVFISTDRKVLCPTCHQEREKFLSICPECRGLNEPNPSSCDTCGVNFSKFAQWEIANPKSLSYSIGTIADRILSNHIFQPKNPLLTGLYDNAAKEGQQAASDRLRLFITYVGLKRINALALNPHIYHAIQQEVLAFCDHQREFGDNRFLRPDVGYVAKLSEYDDATRINPDLTSFWLASHLAEECFNAGRDLEVVIETSLLVALLRKVLGDVLPAAIQPLPSYRDAVQLSVTA